MIANIKILEKYCTDYKNIENYDEALKSTLKYDLHHRLEISEMQSSSDLKFLHLYYHRPPEELIFLSHGEHIRLHNANRSEETRQRMSDAKKGEKCYMYGKHPSAESRQKMSAAQKGEKSYMYGKPKSAETKQKISEAMKGKPGACLGRHWHLENGKHVWTE